MRAAAQIDWSQSSLVETNPRVQSGVPVLRGTRLPVSAIIENFDHGMSALEISERSKSRKIELTRFWLTPRAIALRIAPEPIPLRNVFALVVS